MVCLYNNCGSCSHIVLDLRQIANSKVGGLTDIHSYSRRFRYLLDYLRPFHRAEIKYDICVLIANWHMAYGLKKYVKIVGRIICNSEIILNFALAKAKERCSSG